MLRIHQVPICTAYIRLKDIGVKFTSEQLELISKESDAEFKEYEENQHGNQKDSNQKDS